MSSRSYTITFIALVVLGAGTWWLLPVRGSHDANGSDAPSTPEPSIPEVNPAPTAPQAPVVVDRDSSEGSTTEAPRDLGASPAPVAWSENDLKFAEREDPDPALSREVESAIQRAIDSTIDRGKLEVHSITCRALTCQILSVDHAPAAGDNLPPAGGSNWPPVVATILRDLTSVPIRNPGTGAELKPMLELVKIGRGDTGIVTMIRMGN